MPQYKAPQSDADRRNFMEKALQTAVLDQANGNSYLDTVLFDELTTFFATFDAAYKASTAALGTRVGESAESQAAMVILMMHVRHMWTAVYNRAQRQKLSIELLKYYKMGSDGSRPRPSSQLEWIGTGSDLIAGDAQAVAAGFAPIAEPSALELQAALDNAKVEAGDVVAADRAYDQAQEALAALRPRANELIKETRDVILFATRRQDTPSQRRILRSYGAQYTYLVGEPVDVGDETAVVDEA